MVRPGLWQSKVTIEKFEIPGMPPEMAQKMKSVMAQGQVHDFHTCLTAEDVKQPKEDFFTGKNSECRYDHFTMGGGKIDAHDASAEGRAWPDHADGRHLFARQPTRCRWRPRRSTGDEGMGAMPMQMRVESKRIGECSAKSS